MRRPRCLRQRPLSMPGPASCPRARRWKLMCQECCCLRSGSKKVEVDVPRVLLPEEREQEMKIFADLNTARSHLQPRERRARSWCGTLLFSKGFFRHSIGCRKGTEVRPFTFWVLGCINEIEVHLAERGVFGDANCVDGAPTTVIFWGHDLKAEEIMTPVANKKNLRLFVRPYSELDKFGKLNKPDICVVMHPEMKPRGDSPDTTPQDPARIIPQIAIDAIGDCRVMVAMRSWIPSYDDTDNDWTQKLHAHLGKNLMFGPVKNPLSAMCGDSSFQYDDNGWLLCVAGGAGLSLLLSSLHDAGSEGFWQSHKADIDERKITASFWGIVDLKYDPRAPVLERVRVLETGDGRTSRFSGAGAELPKIFKERYRLEEHQGVAAKHAIVSANKKLTHDVMEKNGYEHIVPPQVCFPRAYSEGLADKIVKQLGVSNKELVVLKLCNRSRGAGVLPIEVARLDEVLREILVVPKDIDQWFVEKKAIGWDASLNLPYGCWEEQVRHWWSNECPHFVVEKCCYSMVTSDPSKNDGKGYDGTMRVVFVLRRKLKLTQFNFTQTSDNPPMDQMTEEQLEVDWLGGYWKLPKEDVRSTKIRERVISAARTGGTAHIGVNHLHDVFCALGDSIQHLFGGQELSVSTLSSWYGDKPELAGYLIGRFAVASRDISKCRRLMQIADSVAARAQDGIAKKCVMSFLARGWGVVEANTPPSKWAAAKDKFHESISLAPWNATSLYLLGMSLLEIGDPENASEALYRAMLLDLDFKAPYIALSIAYLRLKRYAEAILCSMECLDRHAESPQCNYHIALACYQQALRVEAETSSPTIAQKEESKRLRHRALHCLLEARESEEGRRLEVRGARGGPGRVDPPWTEYDDEMQHELSPTRHATWGGKGTAPDKLPAMVGWRFFGWRT
eukprot:gnl/TRDRNA2_/TRDRNA2_162823_c0_seq1.p1 gnl/TRDRNA2_/TRDRNA2_162823_c0~~gnl/TRDRNA2_/TRDRNA2_162823_c0_seq1.p1  ORF type:complete len:904 (-),score=152.34 gnl/TRDRNA2_/TRDRNA2_162823_c0_seq1:152-2863(-)